MDNDAESFQSYIGHIKNDDVNKILEKIDIGPINNIINIVKVNNLKSEISEQS